RDTTAATDSTGATGDMPPATSDTSAMDTDATTGLTVTTVDLGSAVGSDNRISTPATTFTSGDTIHASVATDGAMAGTLTATWTVHDGQVLATQQKAHPARPP